jgi:hypothetical protein
MSSGEYSEMEALLIKQMNNEQIDEDRLYGLDLLHRSQNNELAIDEMRDLESFKAERRKERRYRRELIE